MFLKESEDKVIKGDISTSEDEFGMKVIQFVLSKLINIPWNTQGIALAANLSEP